MKIKIDRSLSLFTKMIGANLRQIYNLLLLLILILILTAHIFYLDKVPTGLFLDESSIGNNAITISQSGVDEYGEYFPVYFEAFGEYKNPIYIYAVALIFKIFGISEFTLRLTSTIFYIVALIFTVLLIHKVFAGNKLTEIYMLVSFGFLPIFFTLSRISFEVITQLTWISAAILLVWMTFHEEEGKLGYLKILACGLVLGTSTYTYSTARLLSFLTLASLWVVYLKRNNVKKLIHITILFFVSLIPFAIFSINNPGALTSRFNDISYVNSPIPILEKINIFLHNLSIYWSLDFLIIHGDPSLRNSTGHGGILYFATLFLFIIGLINIIFNKKLDRFNIFLLINLLLSPTAAALTSEGTPQSLRSLLIGYYILLISCYSFGSLLAIRDKRLRVLSIACISFSLISGIIDYQLDYFLVYPPMSAEWMGSFDFKSSLEFAIEKNPKEIIFINELELAAANLQFYSHLVDNPNKIPIKTSQIPKSAPGICILYDRRGKVEQELNQFSYPHINFRSFKKINSLEKFLGVKPFTGIIKVRCYNNAN